MWTKRKGDEPCGQSPFCYNVLTKLFKNQYAADPANVNVIKNIITAEPIATISSTRRSFCCLLTVLMCSRWLQIMSIKAAQANKHIAIIRITILNCEIINNIPLYNCIILYKRKQRKSTVKRPLTLRTLHSVGIDTIWHNRNCESYRLPTISCNMTCLISIHMPCDHITSRMKAIFIDCSN